MTTTAEWDLARLKEALELAKARGVDDMRRRGIDAGPQGVGDLAVSMREIAVRALMAQHDVDRDGAFRMLAAAEQERQGQAERDARNPGEVVVREKAARDERESRRLIKAVSDAGIPVRPEIVVALVNGTGLVTQPCQDAHRWLGTPRRVLALLGDMGTGKTVAACAVALASLRSRRSVAYVRETDVIRWARSGALASEEKLARLSDVDLLIIDELDQALAQDAEQASVAVAQVVDSRVRRGRTVLVGNLSGADFVRRYGRRCADRIREIGEVHEYRAKSLRSETQLQQAEHTPDAYQVGAWGRR